MKLTKLEQIAADMNQYRQRVEMYIATIEATLSTLVINMEKNDVATIENLLAYYNDEARPKIVSARKALEEARKLEPEWRYEIQHGPEGEANYAWLYLGSEMVATMKTHHAISLSASLAAAEERGRIEERERFREAIRKAGLKARDEVVEGLAGDGSPDNDLADYLERIVDACANAITKEPTP